MKKAITVEIDLPDDLGEMSHQDIYLVVRTNFKKGSILTRYNNNFDIYTLFGILHFILEELYRMATPDKYPEYKQIIRQVGDKIIEVPADKKD